jgi:cytochrome c-type biogenesis protein CcmH/NrfG
MSNIHEPRLSPGTSHVPPEFDRQKPLNLDDAVAAYREAVRVKPDYAEACYNLATALQAQEKFDEADEAYEKAKRLKPDIGEEP